MNIKKRNSRHLHHPFHFNYLLVFPIIFFIFMALGILSVQKAQYDLKNIGRYLRGATNDKDRPGITYHKVRSFDTIESIADEYQVSVQSIMWANENLPYGITEDTVIIIPPITGVIHTVESFETIESIAALYKVDPDTIRFYRYNTFTNDPAFPLVPGQILFVPGGQKPSSVLGTSTSLLLTTIQRIKRLFSIIQH